MNKKHIISGISVLAVLAATAGSTGIAMAANNSKVAKNINKNRPNIERFEGKRDGGKMQNLTEEQKAAMKTKMDAINAALKAGDYEAWVKAEKDLNANSPMLNKITKDNFADYAKKFQDREAEMTAQKAKMDTVKAALAAGDYNAWVTAEKSVNENSPALSKINSSNFSKYVQMYNLEQQAESLAKELGLPGHGFGEGRGGGMGRGFGMMENSK